MTMQARFLSFGAAVIFVLIAAVAMQRIGSSVPLKLIVLGLAILLVGPSRVYMGQHWASDALAGYTLGFAYLLVTITVYRWWLQRHPKPPTPPKEVLRT